MPKILPVRLVEQPQPLYHVSVVRWFSDMPRSFTARVLLFRRPDDVVERFLPFIEYQRDLYHLSPSWQNNAARALGLFWDFCVVHADRNWKPRELLRRFAMTLLSGTMRVDHPEPTRTLMWPSMPLERARGMITHVEQFAEWCQAQHGEEAPLAREDVALVANTGAGLAALLMWSRLRKVSMLQHLKRSPTSLKRSNARPEGRSGKGKETQGAKHFPAEHAERLLWEGHKRPGMDTEPNDFLRYNIRDIMIALLDGWGGLRRSEGLHLWYTDISEDPRAPGHARVLLAHPEESPMRYEDPLTGADRTSTRKETLSRVYGLLARNAVKRGAYHVGWKGMALNDEYQSEVFWIDEHARAAFWALYVGYMRFVRPAVMERRREMIREVKNSFVGADHPFLFVSEEINPKSGLPGEPYSQKAYERNHQAAVRRIGLPHGKQYGTSTHGLRHLYGQTLENQGIPPDIIRAGMHHINVLSHLIYTRPMPEKVNAVLRSAQQRIVDGATIVAPLGSTTKQELLRLQDLIDHGGTLV